MIEHGRFIVGSGFSGTILARKIAEEDGTPYYPVATGDSTALYEKYLGEVAKYKNLFLCGRLAEFKYYNIDVCIEHALTYFENVRDYLSRKKQ